MPNDLLSELQADYHNELLEKGNLRKSRVVHAPFTSQPWRSAGYLARVLRSTCANCGAQVDSLMGIFHVETRGSDKREQVMPAKGFQLPPSAPAKREILPITTQSCLDCIPEAFMENRK
jgi:hypothetical protein